MSGHFYKYSSVIILLLFKTTQWAACQTAAPSSVILTPTDNFKEILLQSNVSVTITLQNFRINGNFAIVQAHGVGNDLILSYNTTITLDGSTNGPNKGLVIDQDCCGTQSPIKVYLISHSFHPVNALLILQVYDNQAPIPGGCNMEQSIKIAPFLPTKFDANTLTVEYPLAAWPIISGAPTCDRAPLQYDIYQLFLPELDMNETTAFTAIRLMSNVTSIEKYGRKVVYNGIPVSRMEFANYPGTGRVVAVVARTLTSSAAYVPTLSYGCSIHSESDTCEILRSTAAKLFSALLIFVGLFLTFFGHQWYKCQIFIYGASLSSLIFYITFFNVTTVDYTVAGASAGAVGALGGAVCLLIWSRWAPPVTPVLLAAFVFGLVVAATATYTPLADLAPLKETVTFWLAFFCVILLAMALVMPFTLITSILSTAFVGTYLFVASVDHFVGSNLQFILVNMVRRATVGKFGSAIVDPPFQTTDLILTITWGVLVFAGVSFQLLREKSRRRLLSSPLRPFGRVTASASAANPIVDESSPLLYAG